MPAGKSLLKLSDSFMEDIAMKHEGDIHVSDDIKITWFKDLDGNILSS
jgi:hypothetical protein